MYGGRRSCCAIPVPEVRAVPDFASRDGRWAVTAAAVALAAALACATPSHAARAAASRATPAASPVPAPLAARFAFAQALSDSGRYTSADSAAQVLLATPNLAPADS